MKISDPQVQTELDVLLAYIASAIDANMRSAQAFNCYPIEIEAESDFADVLFEMLNLFLTSQQMPVDGYAKRVFMMVRVLSVMHCSSLGVLKKLVETVKATGEDMTDAEFSSLRRMVHEL